MSEELQAAAKRLRGIEGPTFHGLDGKTHISAREYTDAVTLAIAYLAEHPADDAEPVTRAWLSDLESAIPLPVELRHGWHHAGRCHTVTINAKIGRVENVDVFVRGDVRRLLAALKITTPKA